jgi:hypothetical protein
LERSAQRSDSSIERSTTSMPTGTPSIFTGGHSSKIITMSLPNTLWMCIDSSGHACLGDLAAMGQREHLETTRVGQDRTGPAGEAMQAAVGFDHLKPRAQEQMERIAQDDLRTEVPNLLRQHALDRAIGADGHERRGFDRPARKFDAATTRGAVAAK